jgi:hypothetical protein
MSSLIVITLGEPTPPRAAVKHHHHAHRAKREHERRKPHAGMIARRARPLR